MLNMVKNASVQATDIYKDPYGYTYSEMVGVLGEVEADKFYRELYSGSQSSCHPSRSALLESSLYLRGKTGLAVPHDRRRQIGYCQIVTLCA